MERRFDPDRNGFVVVCFRVVVIAQLIVGYVVIAIAYIFTQVNVVIVCLTAIRFIFILAGFEFVFFIVIIVVVLFSLFKGGIFFQFFLDPLFQVGSRNLEQFH